MRDWARLLVSWYKRECDEFEGYVTRKIVIKSGHTRLLVTIRPIDEVVDVRDCQETQG
jgi:hypothetical protein